MKSVLDYSPAIPIKGVGRGQWLPALLLFAATLSLYQLDTESLWIDELYSIHDAQPIDWSSSRPLYYILLHVWMQFGTSDAWLRGLAVLFGLGSILLTYQLGCQLSKPVGAIAALMLSLSPLFINHAQEVRMYTLSTFLTLAGTLALWRALEKPKRFLIGTWAVARLLAILTTPLNITLLLPDGVLICWQFLHRRRVLVAFAGGFLLIGALWLPLAISLATSAGPEYMAGSAANVSHPDFREVFIYPLRTFTSLSQDVAKFEALGTFPQAIAYFYKLYSVLLLGLVAFALLRKHRTPQLLQVAAWAVLPSAGILLISYLSSSIWKPRYLLFVVPYLFILLAVGYLRVWRCHRRLAIAIALIYALAAGGALTHYYTTTSREDWRGTAQIISVHEQPEDAIALSVAYSRPLLGITHYYQGSASINLLGQFYASSQAQREQELAENLQQRLTSLHSRLWIVVRWAKSSKRQEIAQVIRREIGEEFDLEIYEDLNTPIHLFLITPKNAA